MAKKTYAEMQMAIENAYKKELTTDGIELGVIMENFLNSYGDDRIDDFLQYMTQCAHRTLQQKYFGLVLKSIEKFAEMQYYDGRNESSVEKAKKLVSLMQENNIGTRMPLI
jgi:hypothetical protein